MRNVSTEQYKVLWPVLLDGRERQAGEILELGARQARHLRLAGFIGRAPDRQPKKPRRRKGTAKVKGLE